MLLGVIHQAALVLLQLFQVRLIGCYVLDKKYPLLLLLVGGSTIARRRKFPLYAYLPNAFVVFDLLLRTLPDEISRIVVALISRLIAQHAR